MKTSILLIVLIFLNTSIIISESITILIQNINIWWFIVLELLLLIGFYVNKIIKDLKSDCEMDFNIRNLYVVKGHKKN